MKLSRLQVAVCLLVSGCSGSSEFPGSDEIDRSGVSVGTISGFSSVIVNGVHYQTTAAQITVNDALANESDLQIGQVAVIRGTIAGETGVAQSVEVQSLLKGAIADVDLNARTFTLLGNLVRYDADTIFAIEASSQLAAGTFVEVWGFTTSEGVLATRIDANDAEEIRLLGSVSGLNRGAMVFTIRDIEVDYSSAEFDEFTSAELADGQTVEVEGALDDFVLRASKVELERRYGQQPTGTAVEVEGVVSDFVSAVEFVVAPFNITTDANTQYSDGSSASLADGVRIEIEGVVQPNGVLLADRIEIEAASEVELSTFVDAVGDQSVTLLGVEYFVANDTVFKDDSAAKLRNFSLDDLMPNNWVEAKIAQFTVTKLTRSQAEELTELKGPLDSVDVGNASLVVGGVHVETNSATEFPDADDQTLADYLGSLQVGDVLEIEGENNGDGKLIAVSLKDD